MDGTGLAQLASSRARHRIVTTFASVAVLSTVVASCGDGGATDVPSAEQLLGYAVVADDLGPDWVVADDLLPHLITVAERSELVELDLCPDADDDRRRTVEDLNWQVASGAEHVAPTSGAIPPALVVLLLADEPDTIEDDFDDLHAAMTDCLPDERETAGIGTFAVTEFPVPEVGDDRFGVRSRQVDQPTGADRRDVIVRDGSVLLWLSVTEVDPPADPVVDSAALDAAVIVAAANLTASSTVPDSTVADVGLANPASVHCVEQGGTVDIVDEPGGQVGYCVLPDGRRIEEWDFYRSNSIDSTSPP